MLWKSKSKRTVHSIEQKQAEEKHVTKANDVGAHRSHGSVQPVTRTVQSGKNWATSSE